MRNYSYQIIEIDIASGITDLEIDIEGQVLSYLIGVTNLAIRLDERSNHAIPFKSKDSLQLPESISFKSLFITAGAYAETITLMVAKPSGIQLQSQKFDLENISGQIADLRNNEVLRTGLTDLTGCSYEYNSGAGTYTIVAAGTNTAGIILRLGSCYAVNLSISAITTSTVGDINKLCSVNTATDDSGVARIKDIFIPAGLPLVQILSGPNTFSFVVYEVL